jgi:L-asparaginase / beta-aspartyl-peptidase
MKSKSLFVRLFFSLSLLLMAAAVMGQSQYVLVIHGGAGNLSREGITGANEAAYHAKLEEALAAGESILKEGGSSMDAVVAAVKILEDSPFFNAGKGAVFNYEGQNELDASIMCGATLQAGAVAGVTNIRNPITAARSVMENSPHVMLMGKGAEQFAYDQGLEIVDPSYFFDQRRWDQYREHLRRTQQMRGSLDVDEDWKYGTVGAVALDLDGNLAAATSTGGMTGKRFGRIGDSPIIGAGTYADNNSCAVSATGHGEYFIRNVVAYDIAVRMAYAGQSLEEAANYVINEKLKELNANGGVIAVDKDGNISMPFNTSGMFRGYVKSGEEKVTRIFLD